MRTLGYSLLAACVLWTGIIWQCGLAQAQEQQQMQCAPHDDLIKGLADQFHEGVVSQATAGNGQIMVELTVSAAGSWTLIGTSLQGMSCIRASGDNWTKVAEPPKPGTPS
jgi:hypothetical protein